MSHQLLTFSGLSLALLNDLADASVSPVNDHNASVDSGLGNSQNILDCLGSGRILLRTTSNRKCSDSSTELNITLPTVSSHLTVERIMALHRLTENFATSDHSTTEDVNVIPPEYSMVGGGLYGLKDKMRAVTIERTMKVLEGITSDKEIVESKTADSPAVDIATVARLLKTVYIFIVF